VGSNVPDRKLYPVSSSNVIKIILNLDFHKITTFVLGHFRWRVSQGRKTLDSGMRDLHDPDKTTSFAIIYQNPYTIFVRKPLCQLVGIMIAIYFVYIATKNGMQMASYGATRSQFLKMTVSALLGTDTKGFGPDVISNLQFTQAGCNVLRAPKRSNISNEYSSTGISLTLDIEFPSPTELDGIVLTLNESYQFDAIRFRVSGSTDPSLGWRTVASSAFRKRESGIQFFERHLPCSERTIAVDYRATWPLVCVGAVQPALQALPCIAFTLAGLAKSESQGVLLITVSLILLALVTAVSASGFVLLGDGIESLVHFSSSISYLAITSSLCFAPSRLIDTIAVTSCSMLVIRIACDCVLQDPGNLAADPPVLLLLSAAASTYSLAARRRFIACAVRDVLPDRERYDRAWLDRAAGDATLNLALAHLHFFVARASESCGDKRPRQLNRRRLPPPDGRVNPTAAAAPGPAAASAALSWGFFRRASSSGSAAGSEPAPPHRTLGEAAWGFLRRASSGGSAASAAVGAGWWAGQAWSGHADLHTGTAAGEGDPGRPVDSLDQLYAQAFAASSLLRYRSWHWAASTGGLVGDGARPTGGPGAPALKCPRRAAEKALVCYGGDVSWLVDICRRSRPPLPPPLPSTVPFPTSPPLPLHLGPPARPLLTSAASECLPHLPPPSVGGAAAACCSPVPSPRSTRRCARSDGRPLPVERPAWMLTRPGHCQ
jgi:hypothetical protein